MDVLADLLRAVRADGVVLRQSLTAPPWSLVNDAAAPLTLYALLRGHAWVVPSSGDPVRLGEGDTAVVRGPAPHRIGDSPGRPPQVRVHDTVNCFHPDHGARIPAAPRLGPNTYGCEADAPVALVTGAYQVAGDVGRRLLDSLPRLLTVPAAPGGASAAQVLLAEELAVDRPGQQIVLDRMLDLLLVRTLREWFDRPGGEPPAWYQAMADPVTGAALRAMHADPAHPWTVAALAAAAGVSRAGLARRFTALMGEPPLRYLTSWRMTLASDLLKRPGTTVAAVAREVGYTSSFAFSTAYKRERGTSPALKITGRPPPPGRPVTKKPG